VVASPPSTGYRLSKFARRNRAALATAAIVALAVLGSLGAATAGFVRATDALEREQEARSESEAVTTFLSDMLAAVDPGHGGKDVTVREVMDEAAEKIGLGLGERPTVEARLRGTIARTYQALGPLAQDALPGLQRLEVQSATCLKTETATPTAPWTSPSSATVMAMSTVRPSSEREQLRAEYGDTIAETVIRLGQSLDAMDATMTCPSDGPPG
jgi:hypothetical protein